MTDEQIHILREYFVKLHSGASPEVSSGAFWSDLYRCVSHRDFPHGHRRWTQTQGHLWRCRWNSAMSMPIFLKTLLRIVEVRDTEHPCHPVRVFGWKSGSSCLDSHSEIVGDTYGLWKWRKCLRRYTGHGPSNGAFLGRWHPLPAQGRLCFPHEALWSQFTSQSYMGVWWPDQELFG